MNEEEKFHNKCNQLLIHWEHGTRILHMGHHMAAASRDQNGRRLGTSIVVLTAVVSSGIFASMQESDEVIMRLSVGIVSLFAVAITSIGNYLKYPELAEKHRSAAASYGELRMEIQLLLNCQKKECSTCVERCEEINNIKKAWAANESKQIALPQKFHDLVLEKLKQSPSQPEGS
jgi:hypothetical protein